jgi:YVTN family beta-propeller protein
VKEVLVLIEAIWVILTIVVAGAGLIANSSTFMQAYSLLPTISAFGSADNLTADSLAGVMYVQNSNSNSISVMDLATDTILRNITLDETPYSIKLSEDQMTLYILTSDTDSGTIFMLNTTTNEIMKEIPTEVSVQDIAILNGTMYASDIVGGKLLVMNANGTLVDEIDVGSRPQFIEVKPDGQVLYVTRLGGPISVVDLEQKVVIKEIDSGSIPHRLSFTNEGTLIFGVDAESDTLSVIDSQEHEVIKTIPVGDNPRYVAFNPDETLAYVTNMGSNTVSIVDANIEVVNEIPVGNGPYGIAFSADGGDLAYVSNMRGNDVSVINTTNSTVTATISAGGTGPHQMVAKKPNVEIVRTEDNNNNNNSSIIARVFVEVPDDLEEFGRGLMFRNHLPWNAGMLFAYLPFYDDIAAVFGTEEPRSFWMKNTLIPLDMIFVDSSFKIIDIKENVPPCEQEECPSYPSKEPAQYVLEVNAGFVQANDVRVGDRLATLNESEADEND